MSVGDACAVQTTRGTIVVVYLSPGASHTAVTDYMLRRFRALCSDHVPLIITDDFNIDLGDRKNEWFRTLVTTELGLCVVSDVNAPTTRAGTTIDLVLTKNIGRRIQCLALPT